MNSATEPYVSDLKISFNGKETRICNFTCYPTLCKKDIDYIAFMGNPKIKIGLLKLSDAIEILADVIEDRGENYYLPNFEPVDHLNLVSIIEDKLEDWHPVEGLSNEDLHEAVSYTLRKSQTGQILTLLAEAEYIIPEALNVVEAIVSIFTNHGESLSQPAVLIEKLINEDSVDPPVALGAVGALLLEVTKVTEETESEMLDKIEAFVNKGKEKRQVKIEPDKYLEVVTLKIMEKLFAGEAPVSVLMQVGNDFEEPKKAFEICKIMIDAFECFQKDQSLMNNANQLIVELANNDIPETKSKDIVNAMFLNIGQFTKGLDLRSNEDVLEKALVDAPHSIFVAMCAHETIEDKDFEELESFFQLVEVFYDDCQLFVDSMSAYCKNRARLKKVTYTKDECYKILTASFDMIKSLNPDEADDYAGNLVSFAEKFLRKPLIGRLFGKKTPIERTQALEMIQKILGVE